MLQISDTMRSHQFFGQLASPLPPIFALIGLLVWAGHRLLPLALGKGVRLNGHPLASSDGAGVQAREFARASAG